MSEDEPTPERLLEMAEHIVEAIAHHHKYRELDVEILGETSRRLRLMAAAPSLRAELAEAQAEIARLTEQLRLTTIDQFNAEAANSDIVEAATALVERYRSGAPTRAVLAMLEVQLGDAVTAHQRGQKT